MANKVIRANASNVSPSEDAKLYRQVFQYDGLFADITITSLGADLISIPAMYGIMEGRDFTTDAMQLNVELPSSSTGTGYIIVKFDTTTDDVISVRSELAPYTVTYEDINASGTVCEMIIAQYTASATQVTAITMVYTKAQVGGKMESTLATGDTTVSFSSGVFSDDTWFDIYTDSSDVTPDSWSFAGTTFTITFSAQSEDHNIGILFKNFI